MQYPLFTMSLSHTVCPYPCTSRRGINLNWRCRWWWWWWVCCKGEGKTTRRSVVGLNRIEYIIISGGFWRSTKIDACSSLESAGLEPEADPHTHTHTTAGRLANDSHKLNGLSSVVFNIIGTGERKKRA